MTITTIRLRAAKKKGDKVAPTIEYDFGGDLANAARIFGNEEVYALFVQAARLQLSEWARKQLTAKKNPLTIEALREGLADRSVWHPTIRKRGKTAFDKAQEAFEALSADDRAKLAKIAATFAPPQGPLKLREEDAVLAMLPQNKDR